MKCQYFTKAPGLAATLDTIHLESPTLKLLFEVSPLDCVAIFIVTFLLGICHLLLMILVELTSFGPVSEIAESQILHMSCHHA